MKPCSTSTDPEPNPAECPRLHLDQPAQHDLEIPMGTSSDELTSVVFLASGSVLQLPLDDFDLHIEPQPNSILQLSLPGHTILVVPEGLQDSTWPGHPEFSLSRPLASPLLNMPRDLIVIQPESFSASVRDSEGLECASPSGMPWMNDPDGPDPELDLSFSSLDGCSPSASPGAESFASGSTWSLQSSMLEPLTDSPLQPLPPSPPSHHEQSPLSPVRPNRPPCKAKRCLLF
ncbi:proline-rich protein 23A3-like [Mus musculus]|uniref:proline-rich protein 23A3-like n=1 Tax=Mus musculus TaxID=10090 RepID=UPI00005124B3|nr:proline-rich protein 23A3-like [Mus musculus]|eukprot:XP_006511673.1 PREDICTED: proline-rich protein 23A3-like [Mus musculus]